MSDKPFIFGDVPRKSRCRWFIRAGATTIFDRGFRSKAEAVAWIARRPDLEWSGGGRFKLKGDFRAFSIVSRRGKELTA